MASEVVEFPRSFGAGPGAGCMTTGSGSDTGTGCDTGLGSEPDICRPEYSGRSRRRLGTVTILHKKSVLVIKFGHGTEYGAHTGGQ